MQIFSLNISLILLIAAASCVIAAPAVAVNNNNNPHTSKPFPFEALPNELKAHVASLLPTNQDRLQLASTKKSLLALRGEIKGVFSFRPTGQSAVDIKTAFETFRYSAVIVYLGVGDPKDFVQLFCALDELEPEIKSVSC